MKSKLVTKFSMIAGSMALVASTLVAGPASVATAAPSPKPINTWLNVNVNNWNQQAQNSTGKYTLIGDAQNQVRYSATVPFGNVVVGDVLTFKMKVTKDSDGSVIPLTFRNPSAVKSFWIPTEPDWRNASWSSRVNEIVLNHTISQADITAGNFTNFATNGYLSNGQYLNNYADLGANFYNEGVSLPVTATVTWLKNSVAVTPTNVSYSYWQYLGFEDATNGFTVTSDHASTLSAAPNGVEFNTGGCIDTTGLAVGQTISVEYSFKKDGQLAPSKTGQFPNSNLANLGWSVIEERNGNMGVEGVDRGYLSKTTGGSNISSSFTLPALTQKMLDGYMIGTDKSNVLGFWLGARSISLEAGAWDVDLSAKVNGQGKELLIACDAADVVNLSSTRDAEKVTVKFSEAGNAKYEKATFHYCQLRLKVNRPANRYDWLGGVEAKEVTPATSPRSFTCEISGIEPGVSYSLAVYNIIGNGYSVTPQMTWLNIKSAPNVASDPNAESVGIGTATTDVYFDPEVTTYNITSDDTVTPYPSVVTSNSNSTFVVKLGGTTVAKPNNLNLVNGKNVVTIEVTSPSGAKKTYTFNITKLNTQTDATLKSLGFGSEALTPAFEATTTSYSSSVSSTTITFPFPTAATNQDGATFVVKQGGSVVNGPGALNLVDGANVVTVEVTAKDGTTKKTYTMTINKASAAKDATLSSLPTVSGVTSTPAFDASVTNYSGSVSESTKSAQLTEAVKTVNGATTVYKLNGVVVAAPGTLNLRPGANKLETIVTSQDGTSTRTYTQTITRAVLGAGTSTDANDARLAVNPVPGGSYTAADGSKVDGFDSEVTDYTKAVPVNQENLTLNTGGAANGSAVIVNEYSTDGGTTWLPAPTPVPLAAGKTTKIRSTVTNGTGTKVYVTDVTRPALDPTASVGPVEGDGDVAPKGIAGTGKFIASNDSSFRLAWTKSAGKLVSQATGIYTGHIEARATFVKGGKTFSCTTAFGVLKVMPQKTPAQKAAAMKMKTFAGKQFCIDKVKMDLRTTNPRGGFTKATFVKIKTMNKTAAELAQEKLALAALKGFTGEVQITVTRYRAWPTTMINFGEHSGKGGRIPVQIRKTKVVLS